MVGYGISYKDDNQEVNVKVEVIGTFSPVNTEVICLVLKGDDNMWYISNTETKELEKFISKEDAKDKVRELLSD